MDADIEEDYYDDDMRNIDELELITLEHSKTTIQKLIWYMDDRSAEGYYFCSDYKPNLADSLKIIKKRIAVLKERLKKKIGDRL